MKSFFKGLLRDILVKKGLSFRTFFCVYKGAEIPLNEKVMIYRMRCYMFAENLFYVLFCRCYQLSALDFLTTPQIILGKCLKTPFDIIIKFFYTRFRIFVGTRTIALAYVTFGSFIIIAAVYLLGKALRDK
jgi:hypothetical protein